MKFSNRLNRFGDEVFAALNERKVQLLAEGRTIYNLSIGTPDFETPAHIKQALIDAAALQDKEIPHSTLVLEGVGHSLHHEQQYCEAAAKFLADALL